MEYLVVGNAVRGHKWQIENCINMRRGLQEFQEDSRTKSIYGFAGEPSGCVICEVKNPQDLDEYLALNPLTQLFDWRVHSLTTADEALATLEKVENQLRSTQRAA